MYNNMTFAVLNRWLIQLYIKWLHFLSAYLGFINNFIPLKLKMLFLLIL